MIFYRLFFCLLMLTPFTSCHLLLSHNSDIDLKSSQDTVIKSVKEFLLRNRTESDIAIGMLKHATNNYTVLLDSALDRINTDVGSGCETIKLDSRLQTVDMRIDNTISALSHNKLSSFYTGIMYLVGTYFGVMVADGINAVYYNISPLTNETRRQILGMLVLSLASAIYRLSHMYYNKLFQHDFEKSMLSFNSIVQQEEQIIKVCSQAIKDSQERFLLSLRAFLIDDARDESNTNDVNKLQRLAEEYYSVLEKAINNNNLVVGNDLVVTSSLKNKILELTSHKNTPFFHAGYAGSVIQCILDALWLDNWGFLSALAIVLGTLLQRGYDILFTQSDHEEKIKVLEPILEKINKNELLLRQKLLEKDIDTFGWSDLEGDKYSNVTKLTQLQWDAVKYIICFGVIFIITMSVKYSQPFAAAIYHFEHR